MPRLVFVDETTSGDRDTAFALEIPDAPLTVREVIRARIHQEAARYSAADGAAVGRALVQPTAAETRLKDLKQPPARPVDVQAQCEEAFRAFERNGFLVLVGDRQMTELDALVVDGADVEVTFLKLIPLVGG